MATPSQVLDAMAPSHNPSIDPLTALVEESEIRRLQSYYVISLDTRRFTNFKHVFVADVAADYGPGIGLINGLEKLSTTLEAMTAPVMAQHMLGTQVVSLSSPTAATCVTYMAVNQFGRGEHEGKPLYAFGRYEDVLAKGAEGWRITRRNLIYMGPHQGDISIFGL